MSDLKYHVFTYLFLTNYSGLVVLHNFHQFRHIYCEWNIFIFKIEERF